MKTVEPSQLPPNLRSSSPELSNRRCESGACLRVAPASAKLSIFATLFILRWSFKFWSFKFWSFKFLVVQIFGRSNFGRSKFWSFQILVVQILVVQIFGRSNFCDTIYSEVVVQMPCFALSRNVETSVECWLTLLGSRNNDNNKAGDIN